MSRLAYMVAVVVVFALLAPALLFAVAALGIVFAASMWVNGVRNFAFKD